MKLSVWYNIFFNTQHLLWNVKLSLKYNTFFSVNDTLILVVVFHKALSLHGTGQPTWLSLSGCLSWLIFAFQAREICRKKPLGNHLYKPRVKNQESLITSSYNDRQWKRALIFIWMCFQDIFPFQNHVDNYTATVTLLDLFECIQKCPKHNLWAG